MKNEEKNNIMIESFQEKFVPKYLQDFACVSEYQSQ